MAESLGLTQVGLTAEQLCFRAPALAVFALQIAVEHAGAERGLFLQGSENGLQIEAEALTINGRVDVILHSEDEAGAITGPKAIASGAGKNRMLLHPMAAPI